MRLADEWKPEDPDDLALHDGLMVLRNEVHAHTDDNEFRQVGALIIDGVQVGGPAFFTRSLNDGWLDIVGPMIQRQRTRFSRERRARERRLGGCARMTGLDDGVELDYGKLLG